MRSLYQAKSKSWLTGLKNVLLNSAPIKAMRRMMLPNIMRYNIFRAKLDIDRYRMALEAARNPLRPDRRTLYAVYREVELDDAVITQKRVAKVLIKRAPFEVCRDGKCDEAATDLFMRPWFLDFLEEFIATELWGHSLLEFTPPTSGSEVISYTVIPRDHVRPEYGDVLRNITDSEGMKYRGSTDYPYVFELGKSDDLGLYHIIAIPAIRKRYSDTDWSLYSERFGSPFLAIKTDTTDDAEVTKRAEMAANFGSNGWAVIDDQDEIQIHESNKQNGHLTFQARMAMADEQIAKLINGQTSTSDQKAFVGAAEVHERLLNDFTFERLTNIQFTINFRLIPFLQSLSPAYAPLTGSKFEFVELRKKKEEDKREPGQNDKAEDDDDAKTELSFKGAQRLNLATFSNFYDDDDHTCC